MASYKIIGGDGQQYGPVEADELRSWIFEGRANSETLAQAEGGVWKKLGQYAEFADALRLQAGPSVPPTLPSGPVAAPTTPPVMPSAPKGLVLGPAIAIIATSVMDILMTGFAVLASVLGWGASWMEHGGHSYHLDNPDLNELLRFTYGPAGMLGNLFGLLVNGFLLLAAFRMLSLRNYGLCMTAAVVAVIPCTAPCCCLGMAAGVWALVVLTRPEVKQAFV